MPGNIITQREERAIEQFHHIITVIKQYNILLKTPVHNTNVYSNATGAPEISVSGHLLTSAGFRCNEKVQVIALEGMLVIISKEYNGPVK